MKTKNKCTVAQYSQQGTKGSLLCLTKNGPQAVNFFQYTVNKCCLYHREYDQSGINVLLFKTKVEKEHHLTNPMIVILDWIMKIVPIDIIPRILSFCGSREIDLLPESYKTSRYIY